MSHLLVILAASLLLATRLSLAQTAVTTEPAAPAAIPAEEIPARAEAASAYLRALEERLQPEPAFLEIKNALPERETLLAEAKERDAGHLDKLGLRELEDVRQSWLRRRVEGDAWQATLQSRLDALAEEQRTLDEMDARWRATRAAARASSLPDVLEQRAHTVLNDITRARTTLNSRFDELLALQDRVSRLQVLVGDMLTAVEQATTQARNALLRLDSPPLWEALRAGGDETQLGAQLRESFDEVRQALIEWHQTFAPQAWLHALLMMTLAGMIVLMRRRTREWPRDDRSVNAAMHVLSHPISSALLVALILTPWMYPRASVVIGELSALALIIPLLRLLPGLVYASMRKPLYALALLYALSRLHTLVLPRSTLDRLLLFVVTVLALVGMLMLVRPGAPTWSLSKSTWWHWAVRVARVAALALAVALVANILGAVALTELLVEATLASGLIAATLLAVVLVLTGMFTILLRTDRARVLRSVSEYGEVIEARFSRLLHTLALVGWVWAAAALLNLIGPIWESITTAVGTRWTVGTVNLSLGDLLAFLIGLYVAVLLSRFIRFVLEEDVFPRLPLQRGVPNTITMLVNYGILGLGFLIAVAAAGFDLTRLTIIAGALGVGVGFGLQNVVNNFVSGLILAFERPVQIGDVIEVDKQLGRITRIGIRSSTIRTAQGAEVIVPNSNLIANAVVNWTLSDRERKVEFRLGIARDNDPARVVALLTEAVVALPKVADSPVPFVTFDGYGDSTLDFTVRCWGKVDDLLRTGSDVALAVNEALAKAGIQIPVPQRDLRLRAVDPEVAKSILPDPP